MGTSTRTIAVLLGFVFVLLLTDTGVLCSSKQDPIYLKHLLEYMKRTNSKVPDESSPVTATCALQNNPGLSQNVAGTVFFDQLVAGPLKIRVDASGIDPKSTHLHGFHVHEFGEVGNGCKDAGGHFNPLGVDHGDPRDKIRHIGDFGNVPIQPDGTISAEFYDGVASLVGEYSIIGKSIVLHQDTDDLGLGGFEDSLTTGHAGARIACCVITRA